MKNPKILVKPLLWFHLLVCLSWLYVFHANEPHYLPVTLFIWSILAVQFSWGFTVGLAVGPARKDRGNLWWSLMTIFMPLFFMAPMILPLLFSMPLIGLAYFSVVLIILGSETYTGVLLGVKMHSEGGNL